MRRREIITLLGGALSASPRVGRAQQGERVRHIGVVTAQEENSPTALSSVQHLRQGLEALGWIEGKNLHCTYRFGGGNPQRARTFANELIALQPDLLVAHATPAVAALQQVTRSIPIVFVSILDPVASKFVESLGRPGGNMTGFGNFEFEMGAKWLEVLAAAILPNCRSSGPRVLSSS